MTSKLPLEGLRVIDLTIWLQGPIAAMILADLGAEVIKLEKPGVGDFSRGAKSMHGASMLLPGGRSTFWEQSNRNKKSVAVNLYHEKGKEILYRLTKQADVMITNLNPATLRSLGVDRETILRHNPEIIYAHSGGFGPRGPFAEDPCQDTVGMARAGFMFVSAAPDGQPHYPPGALSDVLSGTALAFGVVTALLAKQRDVPVPTVDSSQLSSMLWLSMFPVTVQANIGEDFPPFDRTEVANPMMNIYRCGDDKWFAAGMFVSEMFWEEFCDVMGIPQCAADPRFETIDKRTENRRELIATLDRQFPTRPRHEWERLFREKGFWCSVVNRVADLPSDPQVVANDYMVTLDNGLKAVALPFELAGVETPRRAAPEHGQHTDEVLRDICGYSWDEIVDFRAGEVIW